MEFEEPLPGVWMTEFTDPPGSNSITRAHQLVGNALLNPPLFPQEGPWNVSAHPLLPPKCDSSHPAPSWRKVECSVDKMKVGRYKRVLERNRVAAARCRERKRDEQEALETELEEAETRHRELSAYCRVLKDEAFMLKSEILEHSSCGCEMIQRYIKDAAHKVVEESVSSDTSPDAYIGEVGYTSWGFYSQGVGGFV
ncbi:uncharacterized protein B0J16DRAFT_393472 [Fusarium flagelliforme]|uniref:uncharacterized protein n=1 Tax=Fusarium flagelliforme TaxID=2675880 RepID=UPI001E8DDC91|nr:uncharacterized protein B0J16DRAFT_393472 [Fusarium flagelliforme]KAH7169683.1 hypothetical protein B0J16DRAFT_393472 [Fusarium flagelliforme]